MLILNFLGKLGFRGIGNIFFSNCLFNWNHFEMRLLNLRINFYLLRTLRPHLDSLFFLCCFFFHYISAEFHFWPSSSDLPRPRIGMLSLVTVSPVITAFRSCLSHHVFDQVNHWPAWVGFETAIFWQCSPGTVETQRLYPLRHGPRRRKQEIRNNTKKKTRNKKTKKKAKKKEIKQKKKKQKKKTRKKKTRKKKQHKKKKTTKMRTKSPQ